MTEDERDLADESEDETVIPLPERDAMSLLGGPGLPIATIAPEMSPPDAGTDQPIPGEAGSGPERWPTET